MAVRLHGWKETVYQGKWKKSTIRVIVFGVPQGLLLGPRLFSIHVNDLPDFISKGYLFMFADDTTMYCIGKNIEDVIDQLNDAARELMSGVERTNLRYIRVKPKQ